MADAYAGKFLKATFPTQHVLLLEFNRPPVNAFHEEFWLEMGAIFRKVDRDGDIRVVVLASALPKLFTAGIDITALGKFDPKEEPVARGFRTRVYIQEFQAAISAIEECRVPVIGSSHGVAYGLAIDILSACDIRLAAANSIFSIKEVDVGLAADIGTLARFPKIIGNQSLTRELAFSTRPFKADEAHQMGFVSRVVPGSREEVVKAAVELATVIASKSPVAVVGTKHLLLHSRDNPVRDNLSYTATWNQLALQTPDLPIAAGSALTKKTPQFRSLPKL
ncbi:ClpP/crotonase [Exidia glandulosa HHB12029]|uniref:ClpP/crotonase n=1 Tax=Exidia glandulosa HHB12029 TaxID=1314781 RepID=A0A165F1F3_EXIGL|nr:ClpP/crotonase [Exidia glandulosa HHB12029]